MTDKKLKPSPFCGGERMKVGYIKQGDCLELMKNIPDGSVDLVLTDPPYGTVKSLGKGKIAQENGYRDYGWDETIDTEKMFQEISRILRPNGKAVLFSQEPYTSHIITSQIPSLPFSYRAVWVKNSFGNKFTCNKAMVNKFEDVCIFTKPCPKYDIAHEDPAREYLMGEFHKCGFSKAADVNKFLGTATTGGGMSSHYFAKGFQFSIPTREKYEKLQETGNFKMAYWELKKIHDEYQVRLTEEHIRKYPAIFNLWQGGKSKSNVLEYKKDNDGYHPTQKPIKLLEDLIQTYSNKGDMVVDFTMGSGSTGVAAVNTGRKFIGFELNKNYFETAKKRIEEAEQALKAGAV